MSLTLADTRTLLSSCLLASRDAKARACRTCWNCRIESDSLRCCLRAWTFRAVAIRPEKAPSGVGLRRTERESQVPAGGHWCGEAKVTGKSGKAMSFCCFWSFCMRESASVSAFFNCSTSRHCDGISLDNSRQDATTQLNVRSCPGILQWTHVSMYRSITDSITSIPPSAATFCSPCSSPRLRSFATASCPSTLPTEHVAAIAQHC